ncbi:MAG: hypothetical protein AAB937_00975 [Patescibacteria group bacterium]
MPKKTKKQKLKAAAHRHTFSPIVHSITSSPLQSPLIQTLPSFTYAPTRSAQSMLIHDERAVKTDIVKTVILVTIILGIELLLSRYLT